MTGADGQQERSVPDLMADLIHSVDQAKRRRYKATAVAARASGDAQAERDALDQLHLLDLKDARRDIRR